MESSLRALLADQADQRPVGRLVVVFALQPHAPRLAVLDDLHARQHVVNHVVAAAAEAPAHEFDGRCRLRKRDDRIVLRGPARRAPDHRLPVGVRPDEPDAPVRHERVELELVVDDHVERDVDDVAVVAAQVIEPALQRSGRRR